MTPFGRTSGPCLRCCATIAGGPAAQTAPARTARPPLLPHPAIVTVTNYSSLYLDCYSSSAHQCGPPPGPLRSRRWRPRSSAACPSLPLPLQRSSATAQTLSTSSSALSYRAVSLCCRPKSPRTAWSCQTFVTVDAVGSVFVGRLVMTLWCECSGRRRARRGQPRRRGALLGGVARTAPQLGRAGLPR